MGQMLATLPWTSYNDARDVEFVIVSDMSSDDAAFWVIDFNQTCRLDLILFDPPSTSSSVSSNEPTTTVA